MPLTPVLEGAKRSKQFISSKGWVIFGWIQKKEIYMFLMRMKYIYIYFDDDDIYYVKWGWQMCVFYMLSDASFEFWFVLLNCLCCFGIRRELRLKFDLSLFRYPRYCTATTLQDGSVFLSGGRSRRGKLRGPPGSRDLSTALKGCQDQLFIDFIKR